MKKLLILLCLPLLFTSCQKCKECVPKDKYQEVLIGYDTRFSSNYLINLITKNLKSIKEDSKNLRLSHISIKRIHWANRDFSEYKEAA